MKNYYNPTTFHDLLMNSLLGFVLLFTIAILLINPVNKKADIESKAEVIVTVTWDQRCDSDVDTWIEDPLGNIVHFRQKDVGLMHLDRDDLGKANDVVYVDGQRIVFQYNQEVTSIRGFIPGEWVVNVHLYNKNTWKGPVIVNVRIDKLNPTARTVFISDVKLNEKGDEVTVTRFSMAADGTLSNWDDLPKQLIQSAPITSGSTPSTTPGP